MRHFRSIILPLFLLISSTLTFAQSSLIHPGLSHKQSDLDRMKYMVEAQIDPWYTSFNNLKGDGNASFNYSVRGDASMTVITQDGTNYSAFSSDVRAAYLNSLMWAITGDERHAQKCVEIFNAWVNITEFTGGGTESLNAGRVIWKLLEAAEIIRHTYDGWAAGDIKKFEDMLVYPGYSNTGVPATLSNTNGTFYWRMYQGDSGRHGNQDMFGFRGIMAMGVFLDNEIMFERALRYFMGLPHREDDLPYASGPGKSGSVITENDYFIAYDAWRENTVEDYGFNGVLEYFIWENGQLQESSRDQDHGILGLGMTASMAEIAWNQGADVYSLHDNRILSGYEFSLRYNVSYEYSFPDQPELWEPTVENGEFIQRADRTGRWFSKAINPHSENNFTNVSRGNFHSDKRPIYELPIAHYRDRMGFSEDSLTWTLRADSISLKETGYERTGWSHDHLGWGGLTVHRAPDCPGDPVSYLNGQLVFSMNQLPGDIEAENFDHFSIEGEGYTYHDETSGNSGGEYRTDENVDIEVCSEGGYNLTDLDAGEWYSYTVNIPLAREYDIEMRYAAVNSDGMIRVTIGGVDVTGSVSLPATGGFTTWETFNIGSGIPLEKGVQNLTIHIEGVSDAFILNSFTVGTTVNIVPDIEFVTPHDGAGFAANTAIDFEVAASDLDGDIVNVEFYMEGLKVGEAVAAPYSYTWADAPAGTHVITAKAIDNDGGESEISVTVTNYPEGEDFVLHYNLDHHTEDVSGNMLHATIQGDALYGSGIVNSGLTLNGGDGHLSLPAGLVSDVEDFTISIWVNLGVVEPFSPVFDFSSGTSRMYLVPNPVTEKMRFLISDGNSSFQLNVPSPLAQDEWMHVAIKLFGETGSLFINGSVVDINKTILINPADLGELVNNYIGRPQSSSVENLTGKVDDFRVYRRGLSDAEIMSMYGAGLVDVSGPAITLTSPTEEDKFVEGDEIALTAEASDPNGSITKVAFYEGVNKLGEVLEAPYVLTLPEMPVGDYIYSAVATDNEGNTQTTEHISVTVEAFNDLPVVSITGPAEGAEFHINETITVSVEASDANGSIAKVELFVNEDAQGELTSSPYEWEVRFPSLADYELTAVATDNEGATTTSASVTIKVVLPLSAQPDQNDFELYPNPVSGDRIYLKVNTKEVLPAYQIMDLTGSIVGKGQLHKGINAISIDYIPAGIYFIKTGMPGSDQPLKFIKQ